MVRESAKYPYENFYIYKVFHNREKRTYANLVSKYDKTRKTISYARYLMSTNVGRILSDDEEVDHINNDKSDDRIENLQILSKYDNIKKNNELVGRMYVELICPICKKHFELPKNRSFIQKGGSYNCCSKECNNKMKSLTSSSSKMDLLCNLIYDIFVREYRKNNNFSIYYTEFSSPEFSLEDSNNEYLKDYTEFK